MANPKSDEKYKFEKLKLLFDYTNLHIGFYLTASGIFAGLFAASAKNPNGE